LRLHDAFTGKVKLQWKLTAPLVGADVRGGALEWLDRTGAVYRVDVQEPRLLETSALGVPLAAAAPVPDGFLVTTAAGEVGWVETKRGEAQ
jgi:hypothetical protein